MFIYESDDSDERQSEELERQHETKSLGGDMYSGDVADEFCRNKRDKEKQRNG